MSIKAKTEYFAPQGAFLLAEIALGRFGNTEERIRKHGRKQ